FSLMMPCGTVALHNGEQASLWQFRLEFESGVSRTQNSMQRLRSVFSRLGRTASWFPSPSYATRKTCWANKNQTSDLDDAERRKAMSKNWKDALLSSGLPLEYDVNGILLKSGFHVRGEQPYSRRTGTS